MIEKQDINRNEASPYPFFSEQFQFLEGLQDWDDMQKPRLQCVLRQKGRPLDCDGPVNSAIPSLKAKKKIQS